MTDFLPARFAGYVGIYGLPPFPLDLWWPCDEPAAPVLQRQPADNPIRHETLRQSFWLYQRGTTRPTGLYNTICQDTEVIPPGRTGSYLNYRRYFGPPIETAGNTQGFSIYYSIRKLNNLFAFTWEFGLEGIMKSYGGTSGQLLGASFWNGVNAYVPVNGIANMVWPNPTTAGNIRGWMLTLNKASNNFVTSRFQAGNPPNETTTALPASAFASSWTLNTLLTDSAISMGDIHVWRFPLSSAQRIVVGRRLMGTL